MLLTKFGKNRIKHEEEEANCEKERKKELETAPLPRARGKLGGMLNVSCISTQFGTMD